MRQYYDWTPVPAVNGVIVRPQSLPPWNPPPVVFGQALMQHHRSGHPPALLVPGPSINSVSPLVGVSGNIITLTVNGAGFDVSSVVEIDGAGQSTTFLGNAQVAVNNFLVGDAGEVEITVRNGDDQESNTFTWVIE